MNAADQATDSGYSPHITIELLLQGERFNVASTGPDRIIIRDARMTPAGNGILRFIVDEVIDECHVNVINGVDPSRMRQPISILDSQSTQSEVAA